MFILYFKDILENLPLLGKVLSAVTGFILAFFGLKIQLDKRDFEKQKLIKEKKVEGDRQLFKELKEVFSISLSHIQNHKQSSHFPEKGLNEFSNFCYDWDNSEHQFLDKEVEKEKENLRCLICKFKDFLLDNMELKGGNHVLVQMKNHLELDEIREEMKIQSITVFKSYEKFISTTNRYLHTIL